MSDIRDGLRTLHRWIGLALALPAIWMGLTGFVLAVTPVFEDVQRPSPSHVAGPPHDAADIIEAAHALAPPGLVPGRLRAGPTARAIVEVDLMPPRQRLAGQRLLIDPVTLDLVARQDRPGRVYAWIHAAHEFLLLPGPLGRAIVGWFGVALLAMGLSGIPLWWPRKGRVRAAFTVARKARGWRLQRELHGALGIWTVALLLLQSLGGASMAFPRSARALLGIPAESRPVALRADATGDIRAALAAARGAVPRAAIRDIRLGLAGRPVVVVLQPEGARDGAPPAIVSVGAAGRVLSVQDPRTQASALRILGWLRALHMAGGWGPLWRALVCALGLSVPAFAVTGVAMWLLRQRNRRRVLSKRVLLRGIEG